MSEILEHAPIRSQSWPQAPRLAVVSAADWDSAVAKGVQKMLADFDEGGYFGEVLHVFPFALRSLVHRIDDHHRLVQYGYDAFPGAQTRRWLRFAAAPLLILRLVILLRRLVRKERIDIVRATDPYWCGLLGWIMTAGTDLPFCVSLHTDWDQRHRLDPLRGAPKLLGSRRLAKWVERFVLRRARSVLCIRTSLIEYAVGSGARRDSTRLIPHGIDLQLFNRHHEDPRPRFGLSSETRLVVFVGRLAKENYIYEMLTLAQSLAEVADTKVVLVGGGIEEQAIRTRVAADPILSRMVIMTGFVPREMAIAFRIAAAVNVVPMGGYSLIEACASGRPVVSYDVEWHSELIEDGKSGILLPEGDVDGMSAAVRQLMRDPERADHLGRVGRDRAFALHDITKVRQLRFECYDELLG